jgi:hypothetical protein
LGVVDEDLVQPIGSQRSYRHRVSVDRVGLAALTAAEHPHPRRQLRWYVEHGLAIGNEALGQVCRPMPLQPSTAQMRSLYCRPSLSIVR